MIGLKVDQVFQTVMVCLCPNENDASILVGGVLLYFVDWMIGLLNKIY